MCSAPVTVVGLAAHFAPAIAATHWSPWLIRWHASLHQSLRWPKLAVQPCHSTFIPHIQTWPKSEAETCMRFSVFASHRALLISVICFGTWNLQVGIICELFWRQSGCAFSSQQFPSFVFFLQLDCKTSQLNTCPALYLEGTFNHFCFLSYKKKLIFFPTM